MSDARCDLTDLPVDGCAHCRGVTDEVQPIKDVEFRMAARFAGRCANCGKAFAEGDEIGKSPEAGGWIGDCCDR